MPYMGNVNQIEPGQAAWPTHCSPPPGKKCWGYLFGHPERSFYTSELIALANCGSGAVQRELSSLTKSGLARITRIGNQTHYQANADSPLFSELCNIVNKTVGLVGPIQQALAPLAHAIDAAFIYGSVAKRRDRADSDVDLLIISDSLSYAEAYTALGTATAQIRRDVNPHLCSPAEFRALLHNNNAFVERVMEQPKQWVAGSENDLPA